jgi:hypothetical protein
MAVAFVSAGRATAVYSGTTITAAITRGAANYIVCFPFARDNHKHRRNLRRKRDDQHHRDRL